MPEVETGGTLRQDHLIISVDKKGDYYLDKKFIADRDLEKSLATRLRYSRTKNVLVKADRRVVYDRVVHLMDTAKEQGATKLMLATEPK